MQYTDTNSSGYFEIANGLATGQYNITIVDAGGSYYGRTSLGHGAATGSRIVNVSAGQISRADFVLPTSATLTGRVTYGNGTAASSATVEAWGPGGTGFHAKNGTDSNGYYELDAGLGTGDYSIWVFGFTEGGWLEFPRNPPFHMVAGQSYALNFTGTFHAYLTTYTANLTGTVTDSEGGPVPYAYLEAGGANHSVWGWGSGDANGAYSMVLTSFSRTAIYNVTASAPGYQTTWALLNFTDGAHA